MAVSSKAGEQKLSLERCSLTGLIEAHPAAVLCYHSRRRAHDTRKAPDELLRSLVALLLLTHCATEGLYSQASMQYILKRPRRCRWRQRYILHGYTGSAQPRAAPPLV